MADFAKAQLLKYGWTEGKGLGKHENGIAEALKPKLKFDTTGVGHDASEYHWWEFVYNKASSNLTIDTKAHNVKMNVKDKDAVDIKTTKSELNLGKLRKEQDLHYGSFIKTSTLENGKVTEDPNYMNDELEKKMETSQPFMLNDEELFKACGGRTAHKGARHGLKLNGKLARIERQEKKLKLKENEKNVDEWIQVKVKSKKKKKYHSEEVDVEMKTDEFESLNDSSSETIKTSVNCSMNDEPQSQSRKTKRKAKRRLENLTHQLATSLTVAQDSTPIQIKKSSRELTGNNTKLSVKSGEKRKRKKKHCDMIDDAAMLNDCDIKSISDHESAIEPAMKKHKKDIMVPSVLNSKIEKRKRNKKSKKERNRVEKLSTSLLTLDLTETNANNNNHCEDRDILSKKNKKKSKN